MSGFRRVGECEDPDYSPQGSSWQAVQLVAKIPGGCRRVFAIIQGGTEELFAAGTVFDSEAVSKLEIAALEH